jgi:hypothetical protein
MCGFAGGVGGGGIGCTAGRRTSLCVFLFFFFGGLQFRRCLLVDLRRPRLGL